AVQALRAQTPAVEPEVRVGPRRRGQPVGDGDRRAAAREALEGTRQAGLGGRIDGTGGFVEHETRRVGDVGAGQGDELALPGRQVLAAFADAGVDAVREAVDPAVEAEVDEGEAHVLVRG